MSDLKHFHFISDFGKTKLPTKSELLRHIGSDEEQLIFVLDSSVCLDIVNIIRRKQSAHSDKTKVFNLIEYVQKNGIDWTPIFALIESCYDRKTLDIQEDKFLDFKNKIDFAFQYPFKLLKRFEYDFETNYVVFEKPKLENKSIELIVNERLNLHYSALLKIYEISQAGLKGEFAEKNIETFIDWMIEELDIILGIEYSLALQIFGGHTKFRSMIKLGASKEVVLKAAWGTAWDLFHTRVSCNRIQLSEMLRRKVYPIFVTKDETLFELLSPQVEFYTKYNLSKLSVTEKNIYPPNYSDSFMDYLNKKMLRIGLDRIGADTSPDINKIKSIIQKLEGSIN